MALHCAVRPTARLVYVKAEGGLDGAECQRFADHLEQLYAERQVRPGMRILLDLRNAILLHDNCELVWTCLHFRRHHRRWLRRTAFVVASDQDHRRAGQYARLAALLGMVVAPFRTTEEALAWLDLA